MKCKNIYHIAIALITLAALVTNEVFVLPTRWDGSSGDRSKIRNGDRSEFSFENVPKILRPQAAGERGGDAAGPVKVYIRDMDEDDVNVILQDIEQKNIVNPWPQSRFMRALGPESNMTCKVATHNGNVVGFMVFEVSVGPQYVEILKFEVHPNYKTRGIAEEMMKEVKKIASNELVPIVWYVSETALLGERYIQELLKKEGFSSKVKLGDIYICRFAFIKPYLPDLETILRGKELAVFMPEQISFLIGAIKKKDWNGVNLYLENFFEASEDEDRYDSDTDGLCKIFLYMTGLAEKNEAFKDLLLNALRGANSSNLTVNSLVFSVSGSLPVDAARYFDPETNSAIIVFPKSFFDFALLSRIVPNYSKFAVYYLMAMQIIHELRHDNRAGEREEEVREEADIIERQDIPLWEIAGKMKLPTLRGRYSSLQALIKRRFHRDRHMRKRMRYLLSFFKNMQEWSKRPAEIKRLLIEHYARERIGALEEIVDGGDETIGGGFLRAKASSASARLGEIISQSNLQALLSKQI